MKQIIFRALVPLTLLLMFGCTAPQSAQSTLQSTEEPAAEHVMSSEPATVQKLQIVSQPTKTDYQSGELFDPTGLVINAIMSDGTVRENVSYTVENAETPLKGRMTSVSVLCEDMLLRIPVTVVTSGNLDQYSVAQTETIENSPVRGNTYFWLGSSVTFGASSEEESMVDFFAKKYDCTCIKEAVSGTTLNALNPKSYVERFNQYLASPEKAEHLDGFICQLSTNDTRNVDAYGIVMPNFITASDAFDVNTTFGAIEYIIATAKETWDCPVYFYTNPPYGKPDYDKMVQGLYQIAEKWGITVIDLYADEAFNDITPEQRSLYMDDTIHPTKAGYREWWLPKFAEAILPAAEQ